MSYTRILFRRDTAAQWELENPVLEQGEMGLVVDSPGQDTVLFKVGDGTTAWNDLAYASGPPGEQGPQGAEGPPGATGATGAQGPAGADGAQGAPGTDGAEGAQGPKGDKGDTGDTGPSPAISDAVNSASSTVAASSKAVKTAYDKAVAADSAASAAQSTADEAKGTAASAYEEAVAYAEERIAEALEGVLRYQGQVWQIVADEDALDALTGQVSDARVLVTDFPQAASGHGMATWDGTAWSVVDRPLAVFDLYGCDLDDHGYYWFADAWNLLDFSDVPDATEDAKGVLRFATASEATNADDGVAAAVKPGHLAALARLASPAFTGTPTAPTPASTDNSTQLATTSFVKTAVSGVSGFVPKDVGNLGVGCFLLGSANAAAGAAVAGLTALGFVTQWDSEGSWLNVQGSTYSVSGTWRNVSGGSSNSNTYRMFQRIA